VLSVFMPPSMAHRQSTSSRNQQAGRIRESFGNPDNRQVGLRWFDGLAA
jgi:hypothetical protein